MVWFMVLILMCINSFLDNDKIHNYCLNEKIVILINNYLDIYLILLFFNII